MTTSLINYLTESDTYIPLTCPQPLSYYRAREGQDRAQNFTNDNHGETANFATYYVIEFGIPFLSETEFFGSGSAVASFQHFYTRVKGGTTWQFAFDDTEVVDSIITQDLPAGAGVIWTPASLTPGKYYRIQNQSGHSAIFRCVLYYGGFYQIMPPSPMNFSAGDLLFSRDWWPELVYVGLDLNEGWDDTGLYRSIDVVARTVRT